MGPSISSPGSSRAVDVNPSEDALYGVLSARRRREALYHLNDAGNEIGIADLAERMTLRETGPDDESGAAADPWRVHVSLYHVHVPKLAAANAVEFDRAKRTVSLTEAGRAIVGELDRFADRRG